MDITRPPKDQTCDECKKRPATQWWSTEGLVAAIHGFVEARCEICCVVGVLEHARQQAAMIPELEAKLVELQSKENIQHG